MKKQPKKTAQKGPTRITITRAYLREHMTMRKKLQLSSALKYRDALNRLDNGEITQVELFKIFDRIGDETSIEYTDVRSWEEFLNLKEVIPAGDERDSGKRSSTLKT